MRTILLVRFAAVVISLDLTTGFMPLGRNPSRGSKNTFGNRRTDDTQLSVASFSTSAVSYGSESAMNSTLGIPVYPSQVASYVGASTRSLQRRRTASAASSPSFRVFCDLDGVLVDFEGGVRRLFPSEFARTPHHRADDLCRQTMWSRVRDAGGFFEHLDWMKGGQKLWKAIYPLRPHILTGVPSHRSSRHEKVRWCQRELGVEVQHVDKAGLYGTHPPVDRFSSDRDDDNHVCKVITCWSHNKHHESGPNAILIDDRIALKANWEKAGGIFVHHNGNVDETLQKLRDLGVIDHDHHLEDEIHQHDRYLDGTLGP